MPADVRYTTKGPKTFTIADGADGSAVTPVDLEAGCKLIAITCADCQYVTAATNITAQVGFGASDGPFALYEQDDPGIEWSKGALPTTGTLAFLLTHATGARRLRLILSNNADGGAVVFSVWGLDEGAGGA